MPGQKYFRKFCFFPGNFPKAMVIGSNEKRRRNKINFGVSLFKKIEEEVVKKGSRAEDVSKHPIIEK